MEPTSTVAWYPGHEGRVIHQTFVGDVTIEDVAASSPEIIQLIRQGTHPVHFILDVSRVRKFPLSPNQMRKAVTHVHEPGLGWALLVGSSPIMGKFAGIIGQLTGVKLRSFPAMEDALAFIAEEDPTLVTH